MLKLYAPLPADAPLWVALSGGQDSMVLADFLARSHRSRLNLVYVHHGTAHADEAMAHVMNWANEQRLPLLIHRLENPKPPQASWEEFWRHERYRAFKAISAPVLTAHHLQDVMETWIGSSLHGQPKLIPYQHANVIRPLLTTSKASIEDYAQRHQVPFVNDPSNEELRWARNRLRHRILPEALLINPGLGKVMRKKLLQRAKEERQLQASSLVATNTSSPDEPQEQAFAVSFSRSQRVLGR